MPTPVGHRDLTLQVCPSTKGSTKAGDNSDPETFIFIKLFPDVLNLSTRSFVDAVEFLGSVDRDLENMLRWK